MAKFKKISVAADVINGKLVMNRELFVEKISHSPDQLGCTLTLSPPVNPKTSLQVRSFHGPVLQQIQVFYKKTEGIEIPLDKIKHILKRQFLAPVKQFFSDGTPVLIKIEHPSKPGIHFESQLEEIPSLADLSIEDFNSFLSEIIHFYHHNFGFLIIIDDRQ